MQGHIIIYMQGHIIFDMQGHIIIKCAKRISVNNITCRTYTRHCG
jgi:hypothetical protein